MTDGATQRNLVALLLTGGRSRRMGRDKALVQRADGRPQARWLRDQLIAAGLAVVEVGQGVSGAQTVRDAGVGPHIAVSQAVRELGLRPSDVVVTVPVDLYRASVEALEWFKREALDGPLVIVRADGPTWDLQGGWVGALTPHVTRLAELFYGVRRRSAPGPLAAAFRDADDPGSLREQLAIEGGGRVGSERPDVQKEPVNQEP